MSEKLRIPLLAIGFLSMAFLNASCVKDIIGGGTSNSDFVKYVIRKGEQSSSPSTYKVYSNLSEQKFVVRFDTSAIYATANPVNQGDINKLYGFSDNDKPHHVNSARIGWRWYNNALELHGYIYNDSVRTSQLITSVALNTDIPCSIKVAATSYTFTVNSTSIQMPRTAKTAGGSGYRLYPYFGGDEMAPKDITILIKE